MKGSEVNRGSLSNVKASRQKPAAGTSGPLGRLVWAANLWAANLWAANLGVAALSLAAFSLAFNARAVFAQEAVAAGASGAALEEIVVSARKRDEPLEKTPVAVTVVTGVDLQRTYTGSLVDITSAAPNIVFHTVGEFGHSSSLDVRGVGGGGANIDSDPAVAIYVDGQYQTANTINLESLVGIESIELLRGPQGTLFGRNAFAGAINITTRNPTGELDSQAALTLGNYGRRNLYAAVDFPLTDTLSGRVDLGWIDSDGFYRNTLDGNRPIGGDDNLTLRPTFLFRPNEHLKVQFKYSFVDDQSDPTPNKYDLDPPASLFGSLNPSQYANWGATRLGPEGTGGPYAVGFTNICKCNFIRINSPSLKIDYSSDPGQLTAITGYQHIDAAIQTDATGTEVPLLLSELPYTISVITQELRWLSRVSDRFQLISGLYFLHDQLNESALQYIVLGAPASITWKNSTQNRRSAAAFAEGEFTLASDLRLTLGGRYTYETKDFQFGAAVAAQLRNGAAILSSPYTHTALGASWHNLGPKASLDYQWTADTMLYASWSRGFKAGGFQALASNAAGAGPYGDETMDATEAGIKALLWEHRARLSADLFYEQIRGLQRGVVLLEDGISNNLTVNAANAISKGAEMELALLPTPALKVTANAGFLDAYYSSFCANFVATNAARPACGTQPGEVDNTNLVPSNAPRWTLSLSADYRVAVLAAGSINLHVDEAYTSGLWTADDNDPLSYRGAQPLLNAAVRFSASDDRYYLSIWARNLTDKVVTEDAVLAFPLFSLWNPTPPRTYGITFSIRFGGHSRN
jgi:iron complex outermembrane receptor protein